MEAAVRPVNLRKVELHYDDGSIIAVPENKALKVGTAFMSVVSKEQIEWEVVREEKESFFTKMKKFFNI